jgi:hypothetical protein
VDGKTFVDLLRQSRLLDDEQVAEAVRRCGGSTEALASSLVSEGLLTPFQVRRLTAGQARGLVLGQYRILDELGSGGFGQVFRALHTVMGRTVAVKVIAPQLVEDARARSWFKREVLAVTRLCHPNIVMAYDANEADGLLFLVMEFVDGADLETVVWKQGPLSISAAYELMRQAGLALQYAHERGMVHRDIKPANLLVPRAGGPVAAGAAPVVVKVTDFGLARLHGAAPGGGGKTLGEKGFLGTPDYVSPEQARSAGAADIRSDLYSLGCTFHYALSGHKPFGGDTAMETLIKHAEEEPPPLEALRPEVPSGVAAVVRRLMAKDPAKRFQTPAELVAELAFLAAREGGTPRPGGAPAPARRLMPVVMPAYLPANRTPAPGPAAPPAGPRTHDAEGTPTAAVLDIPVVPRTERIPPAWETAHGHAAPVQPAPPEPPAAPAAAARVAAPTLAATGDRTAASPVAPADDAPAPPPWPDAALRAAWVRWRAVVAAFAAPGGEPEIDEPTYRALHRELLARCRAHAAVRGERGQVAGKLESLAEPWLTPETLAAADPTTLATLLRACDRAGADAFGVARGGLGLGWVLVLALAAAGAGGLYFAAQSAGLLPGAPVLKAR